MAEFYWEGWENKDDPMYICSARVVVCSNTGIKNINILTQFYMYVFLLGQRC